MPINKNHEFEDLDGVKCAIVEKNVSKERVEFLKALLEFNRYEVIVVASPAPKAVPVKPLAAPAKVASDVIAASVPSAEATTAPSDPAGATSSNISSPIPVTNPVASPVTEKTVDVSATQNALPNGVAQTKEPTSDLTSPDVSSPPPPPETFTVGVSDVTFNPINAIFGRLLKTPDGHVVTLAYWEQRENISQDEVPYFERG